MYNQYATFYIIIFWVFLLFGVVHLVSINAQLSIKTSSDNNITKIENITPFYIATVYGQCSDPQILKSDPYLMFQNNCIEKAMITGIGLVTNNLTFTNIVIDNKTVFGQGKGTIFTKDGEKIDWNAYDGNPVLNKSKVYDELIYLPGKYQYYNGLIYFNSTSDEKFAFLNNTFGVYMNPEDSGRKIWLLK